MILGTNPAGVLLALLSYASKGFPIQRNFLAQGCHCHSALQEISWPSSPALKPAPLTSKGAVTYLTTKITIGHIARSRLLPGGTLPVLERARVPAQRSRASPLSPDDLVLPRCGARRVSSERRWLVRGSASVESGVLWGMARLEGLGASEQSAALDAAFASCWLLTPLLDGIAAFGNLWPHDDKALAPAPNRSATHHRHRSFKK